MFANTSTSETNLNPISQWEDDGGPAHQSVAGPRPCINVGTLERALSIYAGGSLFAWGISGRSIPGLMVAALGGALVYRGATGHCRLYDALEISTAERKANSGGGCQSNIAGERSP